MENKDKKSERSPVTISSLAFPVLIIALLVLGFLLRGTLAPLLSKRDALRAWVSSFGAFGWLVFIAMQVLQVVIFVIPGEVMQVSGGFIYGFWAGLALTTAGIALGSAINFALGRLLGPSFLQSVLRREQYEKLKDSADDAKTFAGLILLFVIPGIPKDVLCYFAGAGARPFMAFLLASMTARMPGIIGSTLTGSAAYSANYTVVIAIAVVAAFAMIALVAFRGRFETLLKKLLNRKRV